ncbi:MAG: polyprenyl synthetase family protein [Candidatus Omnitrophota bacterium]|jgi:geranylgeranyl diphosphate synthase type I
MLSKIKNTLEKELVRYTRRADKLYSLNRISPALFSHIEDFILRRGKRIRPILFIIGYLGFANKPAKGLYTGALSMELIHDFILVHDDIIDKSDTRRGKLSMHAMLDAYLAKHNHAKYSGKDLAIVIGDIIYAMGIAAFLAIDENPGRKEKALKKLIDAAVFTGSGEFLELIYGSKAINKIKRGDIYKVYDLKTAVYSFAAPLSLGAMLAGARKEEIDRLFKCGIYLGRAFQIKDDIADILEPAKTRLIDLREAKITLLVWHACRSSGKKERLALERVLKKNNASYSELLEAHGIIINSGAIDHAWTEINAFAKKAKAFCASSRLREVYKKILIKYCEELLS